MIIFGGHRKVTEKSVKKIIESSNDDRKGPNREKHSKLK